MNLCLPILLLLVEFACGTLSPLSLQSFIDWDKDPLHIKHTWPSAPHGWEYASRPAPGTKIGMRIGLRQSGIDSLLGALMNSSDPLHPYYGEHLSKEEAETYMAPHSDTIAAVHSWLSHHKVPISSELASRPSDTISMQVDLEQAEQLFDATYNIYRHSESGETILRTLSYSLPKSLLEHIDVVSPTTYFGTTKSMRRASFLPPEFVRYSTWKDESRKIPQASDVVSGMLGAVVNELTPSCNVFITPDCLRRLYNTTDYVPRSVNRNKLGVAGYLEQYANDADLQTFFKKFRPDAQGYTIPTTSVNGGANDQSKPGVEANLDVQYASGISFPTPVLYYSTGGSPPFTADSQTTTNTNEPYLDWLSYILALPDDQIPKVITTSYGDDEQTVPREYATRVCNLFAQLGARGVSIFFSSGDYGVGGGDCLNNDGSGTAQFQPVFPASCPFVTTVGGTVRTNPEIAVKFSGGGFSRYFSQPSYQRDHVQKYLSSMSNTYTALFTATGRAYPDLSAQANGYQVVVGGRVLSVGGTSASAPTVAAIFALLNDLRLSQNRTVLGFINPLIYSLSAKNVGAAPVGFNDITQGSNPGCHTNGFEAAVGWDPVTGLGTPDFAKLRKLV